jgi:Brp/Blh family beta-carotene 15,15'-monooxygenase
MLMVILFWAASPVIGLSAFLIYSAWHFGETDLREWGFPSIGLSFLWGTLLLTLILIPHSMEVNTVLQVMGISKVTWSTEFMDMVYRMALTLGLFMGLWFRSIPWLVAVVTLGLTATIPLATAFGIYFVLQHSLSGWNHLKLSHKWTNTEMWMKALPFTIGAVVLFLLVFRFDKNSLLAWSSYFLVFLSAISLPHIYFMSKLYKDRF